MVDLFYTMVILLNTVVELPNTVVDLPNTLVDLPNTVIDLPNTIVDLPNIMVDLPSTIDCREELHMQQELPKRSYPRGAAKDRGCLKKDKKPLDKISFMLDGNYRDAKNALLFGNRDRLDNSKKD